QSATNTKPCWNGGQQTGKLAIWEVTSTGDHVGTAPIAEFTLAASANGIATFRTPEKWEIFSPGKHLIRAEYEGTACSDEYLPNPRCGPQNRQTVDVAGYYGSKSSLWTQDVHLSGLIGLNSVTLGSTSAFADSFNSSLGGYAATASNRARVLSNGTITLKGGKVYGNVLSANGSVVLETGSAVSGDVTGLSIVGPGLVGGARTTHGSALMTPAIPAACGPYTNPSSSITGNYKYDPATGNLSVAGNAVVRLAGNYCFGSLTITGGAILQVETGPVTIRLTGVLNAGGGSVANGSGRPSNLRIESSYTGPGGVTLRGNNSAYLTIYAPGTDVNLQGGTIFGAVVGKTLTVQGGTDVHYDNANTRAGWTIWSIWSSFVGLLPVAP
ncbi:MAG TPA: hypothetical protein VM096_18365, partial [Vicinamibacterales bacterium]|nr:hypothetical protein [Vicinamibacterales bacterium]